MVDVRLNPNQPPGQAVVSDEDVDFDPHRAISKFVLFNPNGTRFTGGAGGSIGGIEDVPGLEEALDSKATPAQINTAIDNLIAGAPGAYNTLMEIATELQDNETAVAAILASLATKASIAALDLKASIADMNLKASITDLNTKASITDLNTKASIADLNTKASLVELAAKADKATTFSAGSGLTGGGTLAGDRSFAADFGTAAGKILEGNFHHGALLAHKVWDGSSYIWAGDGAAPTTGWTHILFFGPEDPTTASGGRDIDGDVWVDDSATESSRGNIDHEINTVTASNTTSEIVVADLLLPGGITEVGDTFELVAICERLNNTGGSATYTYRLKFGTTTVIASGAIAASAAATIEMITFRATFIVRSATAQVAGCWMGATVGTLGTMGPINAPRTLVGTGVSTENLSGDKAVQLTVQMGTASTNSTFAVRSCVLSLSKVT